jgi:hypothetical protein
MSIKAKRLIIILLAFFIVSASFLSYGIYIYVRYKHFNPPISECINTNDSTNIVGPVSSWNFEEINDGVIDDISGNRNNGNVKSAINMDYPKNLIKNFFDFNFIFGIAKTVKGIKGNAIQVNGGQWVSGGNYKAYNTNTFTISVWVWRDDNTEMVPTIMAKGSWPYYDGWWLTTKPYSRYIDMGIAWGEGWEHIHSGYELPLKEWHNIAVTMDNNKHTIQFFIDGLPFGDPHVNIHEWRINWNHDLFIGDYDGSGRWPWYGKIDEVKYYNRILSNEEIQDTFKALKVS